MKKRVAVAGLVAAGLTVVATAVPSSAAPAESVASSGGGLHATSSAKAANVAAKAAVGFSITGAKCYSNAITFTAETYENGRSGVQQFRQQARLQEYTTRGWVNATPLSKVKSTKFPNDARNFSFTRDWKATHAVTGTSYRVIWQGFYLNGSGKALFKTKQIKVNCL
ncbi:exported hypothetical protein [Nostocoides japonicum T1-X7]|uniref:Uncharacterized protein n=1 Tax=Nostocoides japonicum T1-X7 TaxID=1194083 RepID=A0A077LUU4_9MICO|nr:hypothetical protein [Tetrasphaera japonica]CCH76507.1 exported hypothetical protein [Tetrasphaera japonica T1-X7]